MKYAVYLKLDQQVHEQFEAVRTALNQGVSESQAQALGKVVSEIACQVINQVFTDLIKAQSVRATSDTDKKMVDESIKVIQTIEEAVRKYLPWSVSFFSNERLLPVVNHMATLKAERDGEIYIRYDVENTLIQEAMGCIEQVRQQQPNSALRAFKSLIKIIDQGVTVLIREPKSMLKFNFVVDKTLTGVINMTTHLGYKRLEKLGTQIDHTTANHYVDHFMGFLIDESNPSLTQMA